MLNFIISTLASSAVAALLLIALVWLARTAIAVRLRASVQFEFNQKLEATKADFKEREIALQGELKAQDTRLQAELRSKEQQLQLLQSGVLTARASRQAALDARRLDAVDALWASFNELANLRAAARLMEVVKYDQAMTHAASDPKTREVFSEMAKFAQVNNDKLQELKLGSPWKARLYVTDQAWQLFKVYQGVLYVLLIRLKQLEAGVTVDFTKFNETVDEVKRALPHQSDFLEKLGGDGLAYVVEELAAAFERELMSMLKDEPRSEADLHQTRLVIQAAEKLVDAEPSAHVQTVS